MTIIIAGVEGCGSELGACGTQEPHPDQARRRESTPATGTTSEEYSSVPFPRFAKEPRKLHIR